MKYRKFLKMELFYNGKKEKIKVSYKIDDGTPAELLKKTKILVLLMFQSDVKSSQIIHENYEISNIYFNEQT